MLVVVIQLLVQTEGDTRMTLTGVVRQHPMAAFLSWLRGNSPIANSARVWLILLAFIALTNLFIQFVGAGLEDDPRSALFSWPAIAVFGALGFVGIVLSHQTGFPAAWDRRVTNVQRFLIPAAIGVLLGVVESALNGIFNWTGFFSQVVGRPFNPPWPGSVLFFTSGAIEVEVAYRLLPVPLLLWLVSSILLRGRAQNQVFLVLAVLTSLLEPLDQDLPDLANGAPLAQVGSIFTLDFLLNLGQVMMFRNFGFLAAIATRVAFYLVWHVAYGNFICGC
jgi:hypothetical protein